MKKKYIEDITFSSWPLIHKAAYCGNYDVILNELDNGTTPNYIVNNFESKKIFYFKKPITIYFDMMSPLYLAAFRGHYRCVKLLIDKGADPLIETLNKYENKSFNALQVSNLNFNYRVYRYIKKSIKIKNEKYTTTLINNDFCNSTLAHQLYYN